MLKVKKAIDPISVGWAICIIGGFSTANIIPVLVCVLYGLLQCRWEVKCEKKERAISCIISSCFVFAMVIANIENVIGFDGGIINLVSLVFCINGFYVCFNLVIQNILIYFLKENKIYEKTERKRIQGRKIFGLTFIVVFIAWVIGLLVSYPGNTTRDSRWIINQAIWLEQMEVANPPIHTLLVRLIWNMGQNLGGDSNFSLALFCGFQIVIGTSIVSYSIYRLYMWGIKHWVCLLATSFYAFIPYNIQLMHTVWKDIPFALLVLLFITLLWEAYEMCICERKMTIGRCCVLLVAATLMSLMRDNGLYAYLFFIPFGVFLFWKKGKPIVIALCCSLLITKVVQGPVYDKIISWNETNRLKMMTEEDKTSNEVAIEPVVVKNVTSNSTAVGIYIITAQQLARVVVDREDISREEFEELSRFFNIEEVKEEYNPHCSDDVLHIINRTIPTSEYLGMWLKYAIKYPYSYMVAWRDSTYGYWYPDIQYWIYSDQIKENDIGVYKQPLVSEELRDNILDLEEMYLEIPLYGLLWSIGFIVWMTLLGTGICISQKGLKYGCIYIPLWGVWMTLLVASPLYAEFRYIYSFFLCLPLTLLIPFAKCPKNE